MENRKPRGKQSSIYKNITQTQHHTQSNPRIGTNRRPFQHRENIRRHEYKSPSIVMRTRAREPAEWIREIIHIFEKMSAKDKHFVTAEIKCFMTCPLKYDSHIMDGRIARNAFKKLRNNERFVDSYRFSTHEFYSLSQLIIKKCSDSSQLLRTFEECLREVFPPTVEFMLHYLGVFMCSISANYDKAEEYCQKMFDLIVRFKIEEYFILFLYLKVKLKANLSDWVNVTKLLSQLLTFAWMYKLPDLQIWCYFELSRAFFFLRREEESQVFRRKSQNNNTESVKSIYREVCISRLCSQIQLIWQGQLDFKYDFVIESSRLFIPEQVAYGTEQYILDQRKLKTSIKSISQECKIRHAQNLLKRVGELGQYKLARQNQPAWNLEWTSGNNFLLTHQSFNKNMGMFFRSNKPSEEAPVLYTIENSQKNWVALREMLRHIHTEIKLYSQQD